MAKKDQGSGTRSDVTPWPWLPWLRSHPVDLHHTRSRRRQRCQDGRDGDLTMTVCLAQSWWLKDNSCLIQMGFCLLIKQLTKKRTQDLSRFSQNLALPAGCVGSHSQPARHSEAGQVMSGNYTPVARYWNYHVGLLSFLSLLLLLLSLLPLLVFLLLFLLWNLPLLIVLVLLLIFFLPAQCSKASVGISFTIRSVMGFDFESVTEQK